VVQTTGPAAKLALQADRADISADGRDLSFITIQVEDAHGRVVPQAANALHLAISGPGEIVAADNGDPTDLTSFPSHDRNAFNGLALAIVRATGSGTATLEVSSPGLKSGDVKIDNLR
jgi:beta-galactosidase